MRYQGHYISMEYVAWSPNERYLATTSHYGGLVQVWEVEQGTLVHEREFPDGSYVKVLTWSPDGRYLLLGTSRDGAILWEPGANLDVATLATGDGLRVWEAVSGRTLWIGKWKLDEDGEENTVIDSYRTVREVVWSPDSRYILASGADSTARVWDAASGEQLFVYRGHCEIVESIRWFPDSRHVISTGDGGAHIWQAIP